MWNISPITTKMKNGYYEKIKRSIVQGGNIGTLPLAAGLCGLKVKWMSPVCAQYIGWATGRSSSDTSKMDVA